MDGSSGKLCRQNIDVGGSIVGIVGVAVGIGSVDVGSVGGVDSGGIVVVYCRMIDGRIGVGGMVATITTKGKTRSSF